MPDDFDSVVADRCRAVDDVSVPADLWSRAQVKVLDRMPVQFTDGEATLIGLETPSQTDELTTPQRVVLAGLLVAAAVVAIAVVAFRDVDDASPDAQTATVGSSIVESQFGEAMESAGVLVQPSAEDITLASGTSRYPPDSGSTQVSAADTFALLRQCQPGYVCDAGWAYVTGTVDGNTLHYGVLGQAHDPEVFVLDDRFFVAMESEPTLHPAPTAWLIDSSSGGYTELTWRDEPTTVSSPEQAVLIGDGNYSVSRWVNLSRSSTGPMEPVSLPRVVDARDGTIRPLAVPDNAAASLPVIQHGQGRIWIGTAPGGRALEVEELEVVQVAGLAYSDDGGATWAEVTLPAQLFESAEPRSDSRGASIAAEGDRIAVTAAWSYNLERYVYISHDAGLTWSTVTIANPSKHNGAFLYVLADKRLLLMRSDDVYPAELLVSTDSDWTKLEQDLPATRAIKNKYVSVNRDGIVVMHFSESTFDDGTIGNNPDAPPNRYRFSTDMTNWRTIATLDP